MDMVFRIAPSLNIEHLTPQSQRAMILGICHALVTLLNLVFRISGLPELANLLLLTCLFELLYCPKVKKQMRILMGQETESSTEEDVDCAEDDEADCSNTGKVEDSDVPTEVGEDETLSEIEMSSSSAEEEPTSLTEDSDCKMSVSSETHRSFEGNDGSELSPSNQKRRWADYEDDDDDFLPVAPSSPTLSLTSDNDHESGSDNDHELSTSESEPEVNANASLEESCIQSPWKSELQKTSYQNAPWRRPSTWKRSSREFEWEYSESVIWKHGRSDTEVTEDRMLYKRGQSTCNSKVDYVPSHCASKLDYGLCVSDSKLDYECFSSKDEVTAWKSQTPKGHFQSRAKVSMKRNAKVNMYRRS